MVAGWNTADRLKLVVAVLVAMLGHYVVADFVDADLGAAMVYLGTGFAISLTVAGAAYAGMLAGAGAILRAESDILGPILLMVGALLLAATALMAAQRVLTTTPAGGHNGDKPDAD